MKPIPFTQAKDFAEKFEKDQVIILSWDKTTGETWVTTYGKSDSDSAQAAQGGNQIKDFLKLKREKDEIPDRFKKWEIETVDRYWYNSGRNRTDYVETTFWFDPITLDRKETKRTESIYDGQEYKLPEWAKACTTRRRSLESVL